MDTTTNTALLLGLRDPADDRIWSEFCSRYQPVLISFGRRLGLKEHDAQDAAQDALLAFADAYRRGRYERDRGRLRTWLLAIARNKIRDIQRRRQEAVIGEGDATTDAFGKLPDDHSISEAWEDEWRKAIIGACLKAASARFQPSTVKAFKLFALEGWPAQKVASELGISRNAVFMAKAHVLSHVRKLQEEMESVW